MPNMRKEVIVNIIILLTAPVVQSASICDSDIVSGLKARDAVYRSSQDLFSVVGRTTKLHIIGETHFYTDTNLIRRVVSELEPQMQGEKKCIFLELPNDGLKKSAKIFAEYLKKPNLSDADREKIEYWSNYYPSIVRSAEQNRMSYFQIDAPNLFSESKTVTERNQIMAKNAIHLFTDSTCDSAIFFVGKAHISPMLNQPSIVDLIKLSGITPITYNLSDFSEQFNAQLSSWGGLSCSPREILPSAFSNSGLPSGTILYPYLTRERAPLWKDFDFSIAR